MRARMSNLTRRGPILRSGANVRDTDRLVMLNAAWVSLPDTLYRHVFRRQIIW